MIVNFLQTRDPPVLPALQQSPFLERRLMSGLNVAFDKNAASYKGYGSNNKDSLGALLFQFFRYYGHEIDFETSVMSVRTGKVITKLEKNWHFLQDNRLCVEEPFNTSRNLGNTADDTSVRGIHLELRRGFQMISEANLSRCCDEYEPPANLVDAPRPLEKQNASVNRPTLVHTAATLGRPGRGRGGRQLTQLHRNSNQGRRASSASTRGHANPPPLSLGTNLNQPEFSMQAQHQQHLLHDRLIQQYQFLQVQEQELRAQLHQQAVSQGRMLPTTTYPHILLPYGAYAGGQEEFMRVRAETINQPPLTAPIRPHGFSFSFSHGGRAPGYGTTTNPSSPLLQTVLADSRRSYRRSSMTNGSSSGSLRAQSQPPRPIPSPLSFPSAVDKQHESGSGLAYHLARSSGPTSGNAQDFVNVVTDAQGRIYPNFSTDRRGSEYIGYYLGHSPPLPAYSRSVIGSPFGYTAGLGIQSGGISPQVLAQLPSNPLSIPPLATGLSRSSSAEKELSMSEPLDGPSSEQISHRAHDLSRSDSGPVVVNGSVVRETQQRRSSVDFQGSLTTANFDTSASDDVAIDTPTSSNDCSQEVAELQSVDIENTSDPNHYSNPIEPSTRQKESINTARLNGQHEYLVAANDSEASLGSSWSENLPPRINRTDRDREYSAISDTEGPPIENKRLHATAFQLSPVKEVRTPSPARSRQLSVPRESTQEVSQQKSKGKAKQKKPALPHTDQDEIKPEAPGSQANSLMLLRQAPNQPSNLPRVTTWQTQKKTKHTKGSKSETDLNGVNASGGEFLPLDESLRKGG